MRHKCDYVLGDGASHLEARRPRLCTRRAGPGPVPAAASARLPGEDPVAPGSGGSARGHSQSPGVGGREECSGRRSCPSGLLLTDGEGLTAPIPGSAWLPNRSWAAERAGCTGSSQEPRPADGSQAPRLEAPQPPGLPEGRWQTRHTWGHCASMRGRHRPPPSPPAPLRAIPRPPSALPPPRAGPSPQLPPLSAQPSLCRSPHVHGHPELGRRPRRRLHPARHPVGVPYT